MHMHRMMILSDNNSLVKDLFKALGTTQISVDWRQLADAKASLRSSDHDSVFLDAGADFQLALDMTRAYREFGGTANLIVFMQQTRKCDLVSLLDSGADDVLPLSFELNEFSARLHALLRRPRRTDSKTLLLNSIELDTEKRILRNGRSRIMLSPKECDLLKRLISSPDTVFSSMQLAGSHEEQTARSEDSIRQRIRIVRRKLSAIGAYDLITTMPHGGYLVSSQSTIH